MPDLNTLASEAIDAVISEAQATGLFRKVNGHEPKVAPGTQMEAAVWVQVLEPAEAGSGLASSAGLLVINLRIYQNFRSQPEDAIDPAVTRAAMLLMSAYLGDLDLGITDFNWSLDPHGMAGQKARVEAGYIEQDGGMYRTLTLTLPFIIFDLWPQVG
jgi:hypothetical protein